MTTKTRKPTRRTKAQAEQCQEVAYRLKALGGLSFDQIARTPDPTGVADQLYANASAARQAYLAHASRVRGTEDEPPLSVTERRALADDRYERLIQAWMPKAINGSGEATDRVLKAMRQQEELHGVRVRPGAPTVDDGGGKDVGDELAERRDKARRAAAEAVRGATPRTTRPST